MLTAWLCLTGLLGAFAAAAALTKRPSASFAAFSLPVALAVAWFALQEPLGEPAAPPVPGEYSVLGARIDVGVAIYVLLDGAQPRYHRLPYSEQAAEQLQAAMDAGNGVVMEADEESGPSFHEPPQQAAEPKQPELPAFRIGG